MSQRSDNFLSDVEETVSVRKNNDEIVRNRRYMLSVAIAFGLGMGAGAYILNEKMAENIELTKQVGALIQDDRRETAKEVGAAQSRLEMLYLQCVGDRMPPSRNPIK